jgi:hypothetical protein
VSAAALPSIRAVVKLARDTGATRSNTPSIIRATRAKQLPNLTNTSIRRRQRQNRK